MDYRELVIKMAKKEFPQYNDSDLIKLSDAEFEYIVNKYIPDLYCADDNKIDAYREQYPYDDCSYEEEFTDKRIRISNKMTKKMFIEPVVNGESEEIFMDRLRRSKDVGRNLFYEEWLEFTYDFKN